MHQTMTLRLLALALLLGFAAPSPAAAQLGRLRQAVTDRVTGTSAPTGAQAGAPTADTRFVPITPEVVGRFERALIVEEKDRQLAARTNAEAYGETWMRCFDKLESGDAKYRELYRRQEEAYSGSDAAASEAAEQAFTEYMASKCGYPLDERPAQLGAREGGFTLRQYAMLKERIEPICRTSGRMSSAQKNAKRPAYSYEKAEKEAIQPRCATLMVALEKVL